MPTRLHSRKRSFRRDALLDIDSRVAGRWFGDISGSVENLYQVPRSSLPELAGRWASFLPFAKKTDADAANVEETLRQLLSAGVHLETPREIRAWLLDHAGLSVLLLDAVHAATNRLSAGAELRLEIWTDPELGEGQLSLIARAHVYDKDFMNRLDAAWEDVFVSALLNPQWLAFTTDFRSATE